MSKEYLEALETVYNNIDYLTSDIVIEDNEVNGCLMTIKEQLLTIKQALKRLEAIDNANSSEAIECLEKIDDMFYLNKYRTTDGGNKEEYEFYPSDTKEYDIIKRVLLKAQEFNEILEKYYVDDSDESLDTILSNYRKHWR